MSVAAAARCPREHAARCSPQLTFLSLPLSLSPSLPLLLSVAWSDTADTHDDFFTDEQARDLFLAHAAAVTGRVNSITGVPYKDDPTIFAWNLINEPRCYRCGGAIRDWVAAVAPAVKKMAPNQLLTVGEEGFYPRGSPSAAANPGGADSWAGDEGQDFVVDHKVAGIDFWAIHMWPGKRRGGERERGRGRGGGRGRRRRPRARACACALPHTRPRLSLPRKQTLLSDNWKTPTVGFVKAWLEAHARDAAAAGVPLLVEEHGKWLKLDASESDRNAFYKVVLDAVEASAASGGPIKGSLFWSFQHPGQEAPRSEGGGRGLYGVRPGDEAFRLASANARAMSRLAAPLPGCTAALDGPAERLARPGGACLDSRVRGLPGTGREGADCATDVDECVRGTADCGEGAACVNEDGGFRCVCRAGYVAGGGGEGGGGDRRCAQAPGLATIRDGYESDGPGKAQCSGGPLLRWPASAPGARPDPLAAAAGRDAPPLEPYDRVSLADCLLACDAAPGCVVADFNPVAHRCRLRGGGGSRATCPAPEPDSTETDQSLEPQVFGNGAWETHFRKDGAGRVGGGGEEGVAA